MKSRGTLSSQELYITVNDFNQNLIIYLHNSSSTQWLDKKQYKQQD